MTPPPTMTTLARVGRSIATLTLIRELSGSKAALPSTVAARLSPCMSTSKVLPGAANSGRDAREGEALPDAVAVGARGDHADAAVLREHRLAAAASVSVAAISAYAIFKGRGACASVAALPTKSSLPKLMNAACPLPACSIHW